MTAPKNIDKEDKPKPSLIPMDLLIKVLEPGYREGILKYYRESWRLGFTTSDMFDGAIRHLSAYFYDKEDYDPDAAKLGIKKLHLGGAMFCILCMADTLLNHPELDDRDKDYNPKMKDLKDVLDNMNMDKPKGFIPTKSEPVYGKYKNEF